MLIVTEAELAQISGEVEFGRLEPGNSEVKNYHNTLPESQVPLFATIGFSIDKPINGMSVALKE